MLAFIWLMPIAWLLLTSFSTDKGVNFTRFVPESFTLANYTSILFQPDSVAQFPRWFMNTPDCGLLQLRDFHLLLC